MGNIFSDEGCPLTAKKYCKGSTSKKQGNKILNIPSS